jgi:CRP-like cAMP-binding protein
MNPFIHSLHQIVTLDDRTERFVESVLITRKYKRKTILQRAGTVCKQFHFIEKGVARVYYYKDDKDVTAWFGFEKMIVSCIDSLFSGHPTIYNIELLEDSILHSVPYDKIEKSFEEYPVLERAGRLLVTQNYLLLDERMKMMVFHTAEERYNKLLQQEPKALQRISLNYIASYLNVTQETLSRIRSGYQTTK